MKDRRALFNTHVACQHTHWAERFKINPVLLYEKFHEVLDDKLLLHDWRSGLAIQSATLRGTSLVDCTVVATSGSDYWSGRRMERAKLTGLLRHTRSDMARAGLFADDKALRPTFLKKAIDKLREKANRDFDPKHGVLFDDSARVLAFAEENIGLRPWQCLFGGAKPDSRFSQTPTVRTALASIPGLVLA